MGHLAVRRKWFLWWEAAGAIAKFVLAPGICQTAVIPILEIARAIEPTDLFIEIVKQVVSRV
jgi:hypothetical protein